jgi:hypothetical protein
MLVHLRPRPPGPTTLVCMDWQLAAVRRSRTARGHLSGKQWLSIAPNSSGMLPLPAKPSKSGLCSKVQPAPLPVL